MRPDDFLDIPVCGVLVKGEIVYNPAFKGRIMIGRIQDLMPTLLHRPRWRRSRFSYENRIIGQGRGRELEMELGGPINPEWAEWFMGFERGYSG